MTHNDVIRYDIINIEKLRTNIDNQKKTYLFVPLPFKSLSPEKKNKQKTRVIIILIIFYKRSVLEQFLITANVPIIIEDTKFGPF